MKKKLTEDQIFKLLQNNKNYFKNTSFILNAWHQNFDFSQFSTNPLTIEILCQDLNIERKYFPGSNFIFPDISLILDWYFDHETALKGNQQDTFKEIFNDLNKDLAKFLFEHKQINHQLKFKISIGDRNNFGASEFYWNETEILMNLED